MKLIDFIVDQSAGIKMSRFYSLVFFIFDKTTSTTQRHEVSMAPKTENQGSVLSP